MAMRELAFEGNQLSVYPVDIAVTINMTAMVGRQIFSRQNKSLPNNKFLNFENFWHIG